MLLLVHIAIFVVFVIVAIRIAKDLSGESALLVEFNPPTGLRFAVLLFPLGPMFLLIASWALGFVAVGIAAICYVPGLVLARRLSKGLERARTDRVKPAQEIASVAMITAVGGLIYAALYALLSIAVIFLDSSTGA